MKNPKEFYTDRRSLFTAESKELRKQIGRSSVLRIIAFLVIVFCTFYFFDSIQLKVITGTVGLSLFLWLVWRHNTLRIKHEEKETLIDINQKEINFLNGDYTGLEEGNEFIDPHHAYSYDIDLFGKKSSFQIINRTVTGTGKNLLATFFTSNDCQNIPDKQRMIQELSNQPEWRQSFSATARLVKTKVKVSAVLSWIKGHSRFVPKYMAYAPTLLSVVSGSLFVLFLLGYTPFWYLLLCLIIGMSVTGFYLKRINLFYQHIGKVKDTILQYHSLFSLIEEISFEDPELKKHQNKLFAGAEKSSAVFSRLSKALDALDQRNNMLFVFIGNGLMLWDLKQCYKIEEWIVSHRQDLDNWFETVTFFDAFNSLANFAFNHPEYTFPTIVGKDVPLKAESLGHPLLSKEKCVPNDMEIPDQHFFIITGANMAGKSTFLRSISLSIVMANLGLPVCAGKFRYPPVKLITSMRTSDSLGDDESYFFSELKRLKFITDAIQNEPYFIALDEILKGTNSSDKATGSKKFMEKLMASTSTGLIATHDLSLCAISDNYSRISNYYFDAEIKNDELYFDYKLKNGICQNMNASFLLKKMGII